MLPLFYARIRRRTRTRRRARPTRIHSSASGRARALLPSLCGRSQFGWLVQTRARPHFSNSKLSHMSLGHTHTGKWVRALRYSTMCVCQLCQRQDQYLSAHHPHTHETLSASCGAAATAVGTGYQSLNCCTRQNSRTLAAHPAENARLHPRAAPIHEPYHFLSGRAAAAATAATARSTQH